LVQTVSKYLYFAYHRAPRGGETPAPVSGEASTTVTGPGYTIHELPPETLADIEPNLDRGITFGAEVPADARVALQASVASAVTTLKKDPTNAEAWLNLGLYYDEADDYKGAEEVWQFLTKVASKPGVSVPYANLAKLYYFQYRNYAQAEVYFKDALSANPKDESTYLDLASMYHLDYKQQTTLAADTLTEAAAEFPQDPTPYAVLGGYYRDAGDYADARVAFQKAIDRARAAGNMSAVNALGDELAKLPQ
jgi:tetratricopeptide (TPR) repeat protein